MTPADERPPLFSPGRLLTIASGAACLVALALARFDVIPVAACGVVVSLVVAARLVLGAAPSAPAPADVAGEPWEHPRDAGDRALERRALSRRRWATLGALAVLALHAIIPLRYYLGNDAYDERFSWRMFSAVRMQACDLTAFETTDGTTRRVSLMETIHVAWITTLRRNREAVMERYLEWRCEEGVESARLENRCRTPEGRDVPTVVREIDCASGRITRAGGVE
jgi:hypothetical protein